MPTSALTSLTDMCLSLCYKYTLWSCDSRSQML
jgi:hypothetical protein